MGARSIGWGCNVKTLLDDALRALDLGWAVLPLHTVKSGRCTCGRADCTRKGKHPRTEHGIHDASGAREIVRDWWGLWGDSNLGLATGARSQIFALDVDKGAGGFDSLAQLEHTHGAFPRTVTDRTQSGGRHFLFKYPGFEIGNGKLAQGIDLRGDRGLLVIPSSIGEHGRYEWIAHPGTTQIAQAPDWFLDWLAQSKTHAGEIPAAIRYGTSDGLPRGVWAMLHGARVENYTLSKRSGHEQAIITALVNRGWSFEHVRDLFDRHLYDASHYKELPRREALRWLDLSYRRAVEFATTHESADLRKARDLAQSQRVWAIRVPWAGRTGATDRAVYIGHTLIVEYAGKTEYHASARDLAELAGVDKITAAKANRRLAKPERGLIRVIKDSGASLATKYELLPQNQSAAKVVHSLTGGGLSECTKIPSFLSHDAFRRKSRTRDGRKRDGLGKSAAQVFATVSESPGLHIGEIAKRSGRNRETVRDVLGRMLGLDLVRCEIVPGNRRAVWFVCEGVNFDSIAQEIGTAGAHERQRLKHKQERAKHRSDLDRGKARHCA